MKNISELDKYACSLLEKLEKGTISQLDIGGYVSVCNLILKVKMNAYHVARNNIENSDLLEVPAKEVTVRRHKRNPPGLVHRPQA